MKIKNAKIMMLIITIVSIVMLIVPNQVKAINPDEFNPGKITTADTKPITDVANPIIGTIKAIGIVIAAITISVLGVKYMMGSVQEKAEYKKTMIPYIIGVVFIVAITQFLGVIIQIVENINE